MQVNGLVDYYIQTDSAGVLDVLVKVSAPHDKHIFDKLCDLIREKDRRIYRLAALSLFGSIVRSGPTWLFRITTHTLLKDILKLLRTEKDDFLILISALLSIIALLPIIPSSVGPFLPEIFDVFSHIAELNSYDSVYRPNEEHLIHLQIGFYFLFHRLYGMYPCNFIDYIKQTYLVKERSTIFQQTIKPLLETVKIHPLLITANKDLETSTSRWKKMEPHDIVFECARLSLEYSDHGQTFMPDCASIRPILPETGFNIREIRFENNFPQVGFTSLSNKFETIWSPSNVVLATPPPTAVLSHTSTPTPNLHYAFTTVPVATADGYSPPETAIEATPETTPLKSLLPVIPQNSSIARAIRNNNQQFDSPSTRSSDQVETFEGNVTKQKLMKIVMDRNSSQNYMRENTSSTASPNLDFDGSQEDQEVRVINSRSANVDDLNETLTNIDFDVQASCSAGGLHSNSSVYGLAQRATRIRLVSTCIEDSFSAGTSPDSQGLPNMPIRKVSRFG